MDYSHFPPSLLEFAMEHERGEYSSPQGGISASGLTIPGQIVSLMQTHAHELTPQLNVTAFIGSCIHKGLLYPLAAKYPDVRIEERLITTIDGVVFSGQYDYLAKLYDPKNQMTLYRLGDVKTTWNWAMYQRHLQNNGKEFESQVAAYVLLLNTIGIEVKEVRVHLVYLNGNKTKEITLYPRLWEPAETLEFIKSNIWRIEEARKGRFEPCTKEETWGGKRCADWCPVRRFCQQQEQPYLCSFPSVAPINLDEELQF